MSVIVNGEIDTSAVNRTVADVLVDVTGSLRGSAVVVDAA